MLAIDIGNTNTKVVAFKGDLVAARRILPTRRLEVDDIALALSELSDLADEKAAWIASVYPSANAVVDSACDRVGLARRFIRADRDPIIEHRLSTITTTGVDRLLSASAAVRQFDISRLGMAVVQCGSAATIDYVDPAGVFSGGYILPGPDLWLSGLSVAAQLPDLSGEAFDWAAVDIGDNTSDAILHGMALGLPSAAASAAMFLDASGGEMPVAVTGGWGEPVVTLLGRRSVWLPDLLLHGIRWFAQRFG
ncbi:MAG: type III pantothenate kinase [Planctomycetes bacterium]|nr:type III pantothenate kinase [Planctomycetota bacterium]